MSAPLDAVLRAASVDDLPRMIEIDDDACTLFARVGLTFDFPPDHPFAISERRRWAIATRAGGGFLAESKDSGAIGMILLAAIDDLAFVQQLSVRPAFARRGIGRRLLHHVLERATGDVWLTTYTHVPWNRPFYERMGFVAVPEDRSPPGIRAVLAEEKRWLPAPDRRLAMMRPSPFPRVRGKDGMGAA